MARPAEPSPQARHDAQQRVHQIESALRARGFELVTGDGDVAKYKLSGPATGKGPAIRAASGDADLQATINHVTTIKGKNVASACNDAMCLLNENQAGLCYGRLAAVAMQTNAVNSSVTNRGKTQGAANQVYAAQLHM